MNPNQLRRYLNTVEPDTWANIGKFFVNYVSDEELRRWSCYWNSLNNDKEIIESLQSFSYMLQYFLESIFRNADNYHKIPKILKDFLESSDDELLYLGTHLNNAVEAYDKLENIISKLNDEDYSMKPLCNHCGCYNLIDEIRLIILNKADEKNT